MIDGRLRRRHMSDTAQGIDEYFGVALASQSSSSSPREPSGGGGLAGNHESSSSSSSHAGGDDGGGGSGSRLSIGQEALEQLLAAASEAVDVTLAMADGTAHVSRCAVAMIDIEGGVCPRNDRRRPIACDRRAPSDGCALSRTLRAPPQPTTTRRKSGPPPHGPSPGGGALATPVRADHTARHHRPHPRCLLLCCSRVCLSVCLSASALSAPRIRGDPLIHDCRPMRMPAHRHRAPRTRPLVVAAADRGHGGAWLWLWLWRWLWGCLPPPAWPCHRRGIGRLGCPLTPPAIQPMSVCCVGSV
jgi:hypothetical protein